MGTAEMIAIKVGFHVGNVITFLSHLYATGFAALREAVQNAIDEGANKIFISIHCQRRLIKVYDNGGGADPEEIKRKFENVGLSLKADVPDKMGSRGIGNLAGLAIAEQWQFISRKKGPFYAHTLVRKELEKNDEVHVITEELPIKQIDRECPFQANSLLRLIDVSEVALKQLGDQDTIERTLREAFNSKLRSRGIELRVSYCDFKNKRCEFVVKPVNYRGAEMEVVRQDTPSGYVDFAFFHNPNPIGSPSILVQHQGIYSIPLTNFFKMRILPSSIEHLFFKGYFEGEIRLGFCTINGSRSAFEHNNDLRLFVEAVTAFAEDVLKPLIEQFDQADREERWRRIAEGVLKTMRSYFRKNPALVPPTLKAMVFRISDKLGNDDKTIPGAGIKKAGIELPTKKKVVRPTLPSDALKKQKGESDSRKRLPMGTATLKPKGRVIDFSEGLGIQFVYPDPENDGFLWHSRISREGVIEVNVANNEFLEAERRGQLVASRYLMLLLHKELTCASLLPSDGKAFDAGFELMMEHFWRSSL